jgi:hypothetical protein
MRVRKRFWMELVLGATSAVLLVLTLIRADWIEALFGIDPDGGNGELEWTIVWLLVLSTIAFSLLARREWRRVGPIGSQ